MRRNHADLRRFYDTQVQFKKDRREASRQRKREERAAIKLHHETLARLEHAFMKKRRAHLRGLSEANRVAGTSQR